MDEPHSYRARLSAARMLAPGVRGMTFRLSEGQTLRYRAGQYVTFRLPGAPAADFSMTTAPHEDGLDRFSIAVARVEGAGFGQAAEALHRLEIGTEVEIDGPRGHFVVEAAHRERSLVFVAVGTGLAPVRAMIQDELARAEGPRVLLLFGCRTRAHALWHEELRALADRHERFRYELTLSAASEVEHHRSGRVQEHVTELVEPLLPIHAYLCGLGAMIDAVRERLATIGVEEDDVHTERYD